MRRSNQIRRFLVAGFVAAVMAFLPATGALAQGKTGAKPQAQAQAGLRVALVVGNSAYTSSPLANPVNDATDVATALGSAGFKVILKTDMDLAGMTTAMDEFQKACKGAEAALFYYAGHGVQVQGENFLIPVKEEIRNESNARSRGVAVSEVLERIRNAGVGTALIFLDACRDNPFPGSSRSGSRGLGIVSAPREVETLIAYATEPGDTAADGNGRNGVFTAAFLKGLQTKEKSISEMMLQVKADVRTQTNSKQRPRVDDGLTRAFFMFDPAFLAKQADQQAAAAAKELDSLDKEIAARQARINATKNNAEKRLLEIEQAKQQALQTAQKLKAEKLAAEAQRQRQTAEDASKSQAQKEADAAAQKKQQDDLARQAALKKQELERLSNSLSDNNPDAMLETLQTINRTMGEISDQFTGVVATTSEAINKRYDGLLANLDKQQPDGFESDEEFRARINRERERLEAQRKADLASNQDSSAKAVSRDTRDLEQKRDDTLRTLTKTRWSVTGRDLRITPGIWDRNRKTWNFELKSLDPAIPWGETITIDLSGMEREAARERYELIKQAVDSKGLMASLQWGISPYQGDQYYVFLDSITLVNLVQDMTLYRKELSGQKLCYFTAGNRLRTIDVNGTVAISVDIGSPAADVKLDGAPLGQTPYQTKVAEGSHTVEYEWSDGTSATRTVSVEPGKSVSVSAPKPTKPVDLGIDLDDLVDDDAYEFYDDEDGAVPIFAVTSAIYSKASLTSTSSTSSTSDLLTPLSVGIEWRVLQGFSFSTDFIFENIMDSTNTNTYWTVGLNNFIPFDDEHIFEVYWGTDLGARLDLENSLNYFYAAGCLGLRLNVMIGTLGGEFYVDYLANNTASYGFNVSLGLNLLLEDF